MEELAVVLVERSYHQRCSQLLLWLLSPSCHQLAVCESLRYNTNAVLSLFFFSKWLTL